MPLTFEPCTTCGCAEFDKEAGFYYCKECQLQSQEVRDYQFEEYAASRSVTKKVIKKQKRKIEHLTSWECYNYVLLGLTKELEDLGVGEGFRDVVQSIWYKYLKSIEVIRIDPTEPPKLQAYNNAMDAEIVYRRAQTKAKKKKQTTSPSDAGFSSTVVVTASQFDRNKSKQALIRAEYAAQNIIQSGLGNIPDDIKEKQHLQYTKQALKELKKNIPKSQLEKHIIDTNSEIHGNKIKFNDCSTSYKKGPEILNRSTLYVILNMALLVCKERIQLGDMLRFMREGHLSFNHLKHLFPDFLNESMLNLHNLTNNQAIYKHYFVRQQTAKLAFHLKMEHLKFTPDIVDLSKRYCKEMNLPKEICDYVINLISRTTPGLKVHKEHFPNYEARVVCFIIFTLKLFFGLDGVTELHLSEFTKLSEVPPNSFNFKEWLEHICYRKLVLSKHHFPTHFTMSQEIDSSDNYIAHMKEHYDNLGIEQDDNVEYTLITDLLTHLKNHIGLSNTTLKFEHSLTPFCDYLKVLLNSNCITDKGYLCDILERDFNSKSFDYLINSDNYLGDITVQEGGGNVDIKKVSLFIYKNSRSIKYEKLIPCTIINEENVELPHKRTKMNMTQEFNDSGIGCNVDQVGVTKRTVLYKPKCKYWLLSGGGFQNMTHEYFNKYNLTFPLTFRLVVEECARVTGQTMKDIIEELNIVETHLCYIFDFDTNKLSDVKPVDEDAINIVKRYSKFW